MTEPRTADAPLPPAASAALAIGGSALAASAFLTWIGTGAGSAMSLRELGDFFLGDRWASVPRPVGLLAYVVPVCGGLSIVAAGLRSAPARALGTVLVSVATVLLLGVAVLLVVRHRAPAAGYGVAIAGDLIVWVGLLSIRRPRGI